MNTATAMARSCTYAAVGEEIVWCSKPAIAKYGEEWRCPEHHPLINPKFPPDGEYLELEGTK